MHLILTEEQERVRERMRSFAEPLLVPASEKRDAEGRFPSEEIASLGAHGVLGLALPAGVGGGGMSLAAAAISLAEVSRCCASTGLVAGFHALVVSRLIFEQGSAALRERFLPGLARGEMLSALATADPPASKEDLPAACAQRAGEGWVLDGVKQYVTAAGEADLIAVYARVRGEAHARVLLLVEKGTRGFHAGAVDPLFGVRAAGVAPIRFEGCSVPHEFQIGDEGPARERSSRLFALANLAVASQAVGIATAAFEKAVARASQQEPSGSLLGSRQPYQWKLADMKTSLDASLLFLVRAAEAVEAGDGGYEAAQAKAYAGRSAARIADEAVQVFGGSGAITDGGVERHWRDAKTTELNPTSRETALLWIARHLLEEHA